ncbi:putative F-box protein At5g52610 [Salvia miltiorrhiza]|uniref:putative F-box protein At5g52610 n=1 Tax=Salvia miltiorrhiza TaxID=226208 RepID=UPI0025AC8467|nr:putative F-box protein At5g52610 [Salvia miltiorrhiza]
MPRKKPVFRKPPPRRCCTDGSVSDPHSNILSRESINIESFPTDLLFEILLRLPADHLYQRARLVCRRWYHIIHSHAFINAQMHCSTYGLLLSPLNWSNTLPLYVTADADGGIHTSDLNHISKLEVLATSCNGLALEFDFKDRLLRLVNPAKKQSLLLPRLTRGATYAWPEYGFAYSAASLAYKVIARYTVCHSPQRLQTDYGLDVLTVGVNESWRHVEVPHHLSPFFFNKAPLTTEGFMHWGRGRYCVTMDVETEIITLSEAPYQYDESDYNYLSTGRCLSLLVACGYLSWEVWELKAETGEWRKALPNVYLGAEEWRIQQLVPQDAPQVLVPLGWVKYPQVLAFRFGTYFSWKQWRPPCIFYNLDTHQLHSTKLPQSYTGGYQAFPHKNNLI